MRDAQSVETAKAKLKGVQTTAAVLTFPPGFLVGFRLRTENGQMIVGKGVMNCRNAAVYSREERILDGNEYVAKNHIIRGLRYYVYMNSSRDIKVDSLPSVWDDNNFGYYHPLLYQYRFLGEFTIAANGTYVDILNQDPVVGNDINANDVTSRLMKTLLARVDDYVVVGMAPGDTPQENDVACFIYEDRIEIRLYTGGDWVIRQKFGDTTEIGHDMVIGAKLTVGAEMFIGFNSFSGTSTLDSPGEGDSVHYINGSVDQYQEYTSGAWVVTANGIKIGGLVAGLLLNMIGCGGLYHPSNPPTATEWLPNPKFRVFDMENNYEDQFGVDDWDVKTNLAFSSTVYKFGAYSLYATAGDRGTLLSLAGGTMGESQAIGAWFNFAYSGTASGGSPSQEILQLYTANNKIRLYAYVPEGESVANIVIQVIKSSVTVVADLVGTLSSGEHYFGLCYDKTEDIVHVIVDDTIYDTDVCGGTWAAGSFDYIIVNPANNYVTDGITYDVHIDELLFYWDKYLDPNLLAQHYTHDVPWETDLSRADIPIRPGTDGRLMVYKVAGDLQQVITPVSVDDPTTGWMSTKSSGWTADSFSGGLTVDVSPYVSQGCKSVRLAFKFYPSSTSAQNAFALYWRKYNDSNISNTPNATGEYANLIGGSQCEVSEGYWRAIYKYAVIDVDLSDDGKFQVASSTSYANVSISYPIKEFR